MVSSFCHPEFEVDAEAGGDAVDVIEEGNHLRGVVDGTVVEAELAQAVDVGRGYGVRRSCQLDGVVTQSTIDVGKLGLRVIGLDLLDPFGIVDLSPEVVGVGLRSVDAAVGLRDDDGEHLPPGTCQG